VLMDFGFATHGVHSTSPASVLQRPKVDLLWISGPTSGFARYLYLRKATPPIPGTA
jgi:hypothetical protein